MTQNSIILQNVSLSDIEALVSKVIDDKAKRIGTRIRYIYTDVEAAIKDMSSIKYSRRN